jgi:hypothetical protein
MHPRLQELVEFRGDKLFHGAVNIDWFTTDAARAQEASKAYVFHGPAYHGVDQADVGTAHGHRLQDTATLMRAVVRRCYGVEEQPFTLVIAGYGTGKSQLGLTTGTILSDPLSEASQSILAGIEAADPDIGRDVRGLLAEGKQPCLVVALNGMRNFDLTAEFTQQIVSQLKARNLDTKCLDDLRPRFSQAASLVRMAGDQVRVELLARCETTDIEEILAGLERQDESVYGHVHAVFSARGMNITALRGESVRDVVDTTVGDFCGPDKPFRCLLILFDEFGRYTEFATEKPQIAGSGALQDLFEAVQANSVAACFVGFIQFELNAYLQRVAPQHRNEMLRYISRYQTANRAYLSINMETLIAHLIEKKNPQELAQRFDTDDAVAKSTQIMGNITHWFPQSKNHRLWRDADQFHTVVRKGCWPLSPYSTWFLFHLAAAGKHLQERSALALLGHLFDRCRDRTVDDAEMWSLSPVDLWSDELQHELNRSEEGGDQGSITHAYASVEAKHGASLGDDLKRLLRAVVLGSKMGLQATHRADAVAALANLVGMERGEAERGLHLLQDEYNVVEWDDAFKQFDILGDAVPRTQFLSWLRQRVASTYDQAGKAKLFASKAREWCDYLSDLDCDFAEDNEITTREWCYQAETSTLDNLPMHLKLAADRWKKATGVAEARGTVVYCYVEPDRDSDNLEQKVGQHLRNAAREAAVPVLPILVVLLADVDGDLGTAFAEIDVLKESVSERDRLLFGNLIPAHVEKQQELLRSRIEALIKQRRYVTCFNEPLAAARLQPAGSELFARVYKSALPFPFDGFSTAHGNAPDCCQELTRDLLLGQLEYDAVLSKPIRTKNRAIKVLDKGWGIYGQNGRVLTRPRLSLLRTLTTKWDDLLASGERRLPLANVFAQLCHPPYGANIASAALALGVFVAARVDKLMVVRNGMPYAVSQWLKDGIFKGKFIDMNALRDVDLVSTGEGASEWDVLLDEWEQTESYSARLACFERAQELKARLPIPPILHYRVVHLEDLARQARQALTEMEKLQNDALHKMENGYQRENLGQLAWGAANLYDCCERMRSESSLWGKEDLERIQPHVETARLRITQGFDEWLSRQTPKSEQPDAVGDFKHRLMHLTAGNLKKLQLDAEIKALQTHVEHTVKNAETAVEARQLIRDVRSWLTAHGDAHRIVRVAESRDLLDVGKQYLSKLQGMARRITLPDLAEVRTELSASLDTIKKSIEKTVKRAMRLWDEKIGSIEDLATYRREVDSLLTAFENCETDLQDLQQMRRALDVYQQDYRRLNDQRLTWDQFHDTIEDARKTTADVIDASEVPWPPEEVIDAFVDGISKQREEASAAWIEAIDEAAKTVDSMSAAEANQLHERANTPPALLTEADDNRRQKTLQRLEKRLDALKLEWLVEKYKELTVPLRRRFLQFIETL